MADLIHLRLDEKTRAAIKRAVKEQHYTSESDFIRDAVRKNLEYYARLELLKSVRQKVPRRKTPPGPTSDVFREFGIDAP